MTQCDTTEYEFGLFSHSVQHLTWNSVSLSEDRNSFKLYNLAFLRKATLSGFLKCFCSCSLVIVVVIAVVVIVVTAVVVVLISPWSCELTFLAADVVKVSKHTRCVGWGVGYSAIF